ncbi:MAG: hypothetical protein KBT50_08295 [Cycloclasticus sp.]|nr:hypothetical protein [Cycloclasticus sp.]MBQ0790602.1 hypothetical protein [Cycloclasticus sp.]
MIYYKYTARKAVKVKRYPKQAIDHRQHLKKMADSGHFWAIALSYKNKVQCCSEIRALENKKFSLNAVPPLPLQECTNKECRCRYIGLVDHRKAQQRCSSIRRQVIRFVETSDRRSHIERRSNTWGYHAA